MGLAVEGGEKIEGAGGEANVCECLESKVLGDGGEGSGEVHEQAGAGVAGEGGVVAGNVQIQEVSKDGSAGEEALLAW